MKKRKNFCFVLSLCLLLSCAVTLVACGSSKNDDNKTLRESLSWYKDYSTAREILNDASKNYTLEVKEISSFEMEDTYVDGLYKYTPKDVAYASDAMYKLTIEHDAYLFDAGDKVNSEDKSLSSASELYLDNSELKYNEYEKIDNSWAIKASKNTNSFYAVAEENAKLKDVYSLPETYFGTVCSRVLDNLQDKTNEDMENLAALISFYDKNSKTFKFDATVEAWDYIYTYTDTYYSYFEGLDADRDAKILPKTSFIILNKDEDYDYYTLDRLTGMFYLQNIALKLGNGKIDSMSYDIYLVDDDDDDDDGGHNFTKGYHFEYTNIGSSQVNLNSNIQPSRSTYTGVLPTEEMLTAAKTFFMDGNYTVSYKADFCRSNDYNMTFETELKITENAVSRHTILYQAAGDSNSAKTIIEDSITIKENDIWVEYTRSGSEVGMSPWYRTERGANYVDDGLVGYAEDYWNNLEGTHGTNNELDIKGEYSDTLKSYVYSGGEGNLIVSSGKDKGKFFSVSYIGDGPKGEIVFTKPADAIYTFDENGLNSYLVRYGFRYQPVWVDSTNSFSTYICAEGMLFKTVSNIGTTIITAPTDFINSAK